MMRHRAMIAATACLVTAVVILALVLPTLVVFLLTAPHPSTPVKSGSPVNPIIDRGTWINISAADGFSIGTLYDISAGNVSTLIGSWTSTQPTALMFWAHYPDKNYFPEMTNSTLAYMQGNISIPLAAGTHVMVFETLSSNDHIFITSNFTLAGCSPTALTP